MYNKSRTDRKNKTYEEIYGRDKARILKNQMRQSTIKHIQKYGFSIGKHETQLLDELELSNNIKIDRQYTINGYIVDGYCKKLNIIFEIDESYHNNKKYKQRDKIRQRNIEKELNCKFIRIKDTFK